MSIEINKIKSTLKMSKRNHHLYQISYKLLVLFYVGSSLIIATNITKSADHRSSFNITAKQPIYDIDQQAQEQRLALQIITTDSGHTDGQEIKKSNSNGLLTSSSKSLSHSADTENGSITFDEQLNELDSQLKRNGENNEGDELLPKRIIINLNSLNVNGSEIGKGGTKLTIGFSPARSSESRAPMQARQQQPQFSSPKTSDITGSNKYLKKSATSSKKDVSMPTQESLSSSKPQALSAMKEAVLEALQRQGGIPTMVMTEGGLESGMTSRKEPRVKFMLNSESIDLMNHRRSGANSMQQVTRPMQSSESAVTGDVSLQEAIENLSGEIDSLEKQLDDSSGASQATALNHHDGNKVQQTSRLNLLSTVEHDQQRENSPLISPQQSPLVPGSTNQGEYYNVDQLDQSVHPNGQENRETGGELGRRDVIVVPDGQGNVIRENVQSVDGNGDPMHSKSRASNNNNNNNNNAENDGDQVNRERHEAERFHIENFNQMYGERNPEFESTDNRMIRHQHIGENSEHNNENTNNYEAPLSSRDKSIVTGKLNSMNNFLDTANRWKPTDEYKTPLSMDNSNLFNEQITTNTNENDSKSNVMSASVAPYEGAPNSVNTDTASSLTRKSVKQTMSQQQRQPESEYKMDERVAQMLKRLRLYTTRDQLIKVAQQLQRDYPSASVRGENELSRENVGGTGIDRNDSEQKTPKVSLVKRNHAQMVNQLANRNSQEEIHSWSGENLQPMNTRVNFARGIEMARKQLPSPITQEIMDSLLTLASNRLGDNEPRAGGGTFIESDERRMKSRREDYSSRTRRSNDAASRLLAQFRDRQAKLREAIEETSSEVSVPPAEQSASQSEEMVDVQGRSGQGSNQDAEQSVVNQDSPDPDSQQAYERIETLPNQEADSEEVSSPSGIGEYTTTKDLGNVMKNNERLFNRRLEQQVNVDGQHGENFSRRPQLERKLQYENDDHDSEEAVEEASKLMKAQRKGAAEIRALEQIIDELIRRDKKNKRDRSASQSKKHPTKHRNEN